MGRQFIGTCGGRGKLYGCKKCNTFVTSHSELTSPHFTGATGEAMLFRHAWNIEHGVAEKRNMMTGLHWVRDVYCIMCKVKLGWMYEMALNAEQTYKERQVILENALICKISDDIRDPLGEDKNYQNREPNIEQPRTRSPSENSRNSRSNSESSSGMIFS